MTCVICLWRIGLSFYNNIVVTKTSHEIFTHGQLSFKFCEVHLNFEKIYMLNLILYGHYVTSSLSKE